MQQVDIARLEQEGRTASTCAAEILVVGAEDWAIDDAASQLQAAGRHVHRCSETTEAPFPCNALIPGRGCPLDQHRVDVVVNIRSRPESQPSLAEMGAICGLRDRIPLVVAGMSGVSGLTPWALRVPDEGDIVTTCDQAVRAQDWRWRPATRFEAFRMGGATGHLMPWSPPIPLRKVTRPTRSPERPRPALGRGLVGPVCRTRPAGLEAAIPRRRGMGPAGGRGRSSDVRRGPGRSGRRRRVSGVSHRMLSKVPLTGGGYQASRRRPESHRIHGRRTGSIQRPLSR